MRVNAIFVQLILFAILVLPMLLFISQSRAQHSANDSVELFVADGQLISHPFRVFVTHDVSAKMNPRLMFSVSHTFSSASEGESNKLTPIIVARNQISTETIAGQAIQITGTLLLFDLKDYPVSPYKGMTRVTPILTWDEPTESGDSIKRAVVASRAVNLGNIGVAVIWTIFLTAILIAFIAILASRSGHPLITFFCSNDGKLSLARTQVALWTVAIGMVVGGYGMLKLDVPDIPDTLVMLMGMSLVTGGVSYLKTDQKNRAAAGDAAENPPRPAPSRVGPRVSDLVCVIDNQGNEQLSLVRAQMVFWTGLAVVMFVTKSVLDGVLWDIPLEMVGLMGMSQAAYLSPKLVAQQQ